jgi:hypothetical protein
MTVPSHNSELQRLKFLKQELGFDSILETKDGQRFKTLVQIINSHPNSDIRDEVNKRIFRDLSFLRDSNVDGNTFMQGIIDANIVEKTHEFLRQETERINLVSQEKRKKYPSATTPTYTKFNQKTGGSSHGTGSAYSGEEVDEEYSTTHSSGGSSKGSHSNSASKAPPKPTMSEPTVKPPYEGRTFYPTHRKFVECTEKSKFTEPVGIEKAVWIRMRGTTYFRYTATKEVCAKCSGDPKDHHKHQKCLTMKCSKCDLYGHLQTQCLQD